MLRQTAMTQRAANPYAKQMDGVPVLRQLRVMPPSPLHEVLVELLRQTPAHLAPLLARALPGLDPALPVLCVDTAASEPLVVERRADLVLVLGKPDEPERVVVAEVQLGIDRDKQFVWPQHVVAMRNRWKCEVALLVIAPDPKVARWASQPILLDRLGSRIVPLVQGSGDLPRPDPAELAGHLRAAVFHALVHCREPADLPLLQQALDDIQTLPGPDRLGYCEILKRHITTSIFKLAEVAMTDIQLRYFQEAADRSRAEGEAKGRAEGKAEGEAEGRHAQLLRTATRLLGRLVALPGPEALAKMEALPIEALEQLTEDLLDFKGPDDLDAWLAQN